MNDREMTAEEYKAEVLKSNFARRCADYEDALATLQTENAILKQKLRQAEAGGASGDSESPPDELPAPAEVPIEG